MSLKITFRFFTVSNLVVLSLLFIGAHSANAASGFDRYFTPSYPSGTTAAVNNTVTLRITVTSTDRVAPIAPEAGVPVSATATSGAKITPSSSTTDTNGNINFAISSNNPGIVTVNIISAPSPGPEKTVLTQSVNFTAANHSRPIQGSPLQPTTNSKSSKKSSKNQPSMSNAGYIPPSPKKKAKLGTPTVSEVTFDGKKAVLKDQSNIPHIPHGKPFVLKGKTIPDSEITIYIFSKPKKFKTKSDTDGNWLVIISNIPAGKHHAELEIRNKNGKPSPRTQLGYFNITANTNKVNVTSHDQAGGKMSGVLLFISIVSILLVGICTAAIVTITSRKGKRDRRSRRKR